MDQCNEKTLHKIFEKVKRLHHQLVVEVFEEVGLFYGQPPILFALKDKDGQTQTELCQWRKLAPATMTVTLRRMEKGGWIVRKADLEDFRVSRVFLTQKGRDILLKVDMKLEQLENETFKNFSDMEKVLLNRFFLQMEQNLTQSGIKE